MDARKRAVTDIVQFPPTVRLAYRHRWPLLRWLLDQHAFLREALRKAWPTAAESGVGGGGAAPAGPGGGGGGMGGPPPPGGGGGGAFLAGGCWGGGGGGGRRGP